jgi:hypothetical protein
MVAVVEVVVSWETQSLTSYVANLHCCFHYSSLGCCCWKETAFCEYWVAVHRFEKDLKPPVVVLHVHYSNRNTTMRTQSQS